MKEYKVIEVKEGVLDSIFFSDAGLPIKKLEQVLNEHGKEGWSVEFQILERTRSAIFFSSEAIVVTLSRPIN